MSKYNFGSSGSSGSNNTENNNSGYAPVFKISPFTKMLGVPTGLYAGNSDYGQSVAVTYNNGKILDGILCKRTDKEQYKLFSWNDAPVIEDETLSCEDLPPVLTKSYAGTSYKYEILAARLEADDEVGYEDDATIRGEEYEGTDPIPLGEFMVDDDGQPDTRFTVYEGSTENGPNSCAKATAKVMSNMSHSAVVDEDSQFGWLADGVSLREDVEGMEIVYVKVQRESSESDHSFYYPLFMDAATEEMILPDNDESDSSSAPEPEPEPMDDPDETPTDSTSPVDEFYDTCEDLNIDTEPAVLGLLDDMIEDDDNDLSEDMVNRDEVVGDLVA